MRSTVSSGVFHLGQAMLNAIASLRAIVAWVEQAPGAACRLERMDCR